MTSRSLSVTAAVATLCLLLMGGLGAGRVHSDERIDVNRELRRALRDDLPIEERLGAAKRALTVPQGGNWHDWLAAANEFRDGSHVEVGTALFRRALHEGYPRIEPETPRADNNWTSRRDRFFNAFLVGLAEVERSGRRDVKAKLFAERYLELGDLLHLEMLDPWPPSPFIKVVLEEDLGRITDAKGESILARWNEAEVKDLVERAGPACSALNAACFMDDATSTEGMEALLGFGAKAVPLLLHEARRSAEGVPESRIDRCVKAITALGLIGDRSATEPLMACLLSNEGWIRAAAATALGDLGDPKAAIALARQMAYAGDPFRKFESWDYPGTTETTVKPEEWNSVEYYVIDAAAADALLAMGSPGSVGWLLKNDLDPKRRNLRIRVLQDALDTIRRHLPDAPTADYNPDAGLPQRHAAFEKLEAWWRANRDRPDLLKKKFDDQDPGWLEAARGLAKRLGEPKVLELMIAKDSCEVLGPVITPVLLEALAATKSATHKVELAQALARVRDPRAVPPLLGLLKEKAGFVRAAALGSLGAHARPGPPEVLAAVVAGLEDPDCGAQVAAMQALVGAPPSDLVRKAVAKNDEAAHAARCGADANYGMAIRVVLLVQEGEAHWPKVREGLRSKDRVERRSWWDLLRLALDLYEHLYDPITEPSSSDWRAIDETKVLEALRARRGIR